MQLSSLPQKEEEKHSDTTSKRFGINLYEIITDCLVQFSETDFRFSETTKKVW